jgi:YebC/PmpR family DNA-binding regulatory protein
MGRDFENRKHAIMKTAGQKSKLYSKYGTQLYVAAKNGVPDPDKNPTLRTLIEKAKREQVPSHVIEKAIDKAKGVGGADFVPVRYEGFGPGGSSVIVDCLTDNNMRTITDVRNCFTKTNSKLGPPNSVLHQFDHLAIFSFDGSDADDVLEKLLNAEVNVDDVQTQDGRIMVFAAASEFFKAKTALIQAYPGVEFHLQEISFQPQSKTKLTGDDLAVFEKLLAMLEDCEDVQDVYHNVQFS